ncbi:MAG: lanthionine synthetase LanC family protein [Longimicrobiaceae bacterium]
MPIPEIEPASAAGPEPHPAADPSGDVLLARALQLSSRIRGSAVEIRGGVVWLAPEAPPAPAGGAPAVLGPHLYDGASGIALFLAALDHVRGDRANHDLVLGAIAPLRAKLRGLVLDPERARTLRIPIGGLTGLGSFIYALTRIGVWLGEPALVAEAHALTTLLTPERIRSDEQLDVVAGAAGTVLALLALHDASPPPSASASDPVELALACARHLLDRRVSHEGRPRAWPCAGLPPLSGFAHGASGISHALLRLHGWTGREELRTAALEGFAYERSLFDRGALNWLDPRFGRLLEQSAWCHGAPGILLARLGATSAGDGGDVAREDAALLLEAVRDAPDLPLDHLCCGNFGRGEVLACAGQALGDPGPLDAARALAGRSLRRADAGGDFHLAPVGEPPGLRPALFRGLAGIGYSLLRLAAPSALPSPLLLA